MEINKNDLSSQPKDTESLLPICKVIRYTGYIVCLSLFGLSSFAIFRAYTSKTTIKSTKVEPSPFDLLDSPTILVCNSSAYKVQTLPTTMASYRNNTMNKKDVLLEAYHVTDTTKGLLDYKPSTIKDDFKEIATIFHGNCIIYEKQLKLKAHDIIWLEFSSEFELVIYLMDHGDDVFIPTFIWPQNPRRQIAYPATHRFGKSLQYVQLQLTKKSNKQFSKPCNDTIGYVYGDCIKEKLKLFLNDPKNGNLKKCYVPWLSNLTNGVIDDYDSLPPCDESASSTESLNLANFFFKSAVYGFEECVEPCEVSSYKMQSTEYDSSGIISEKINQKFKQAMNLSLPNNTKTFSTMISFLNTDIELTEEIRLYTFFDFVSSVGGNLGLFTGFSVLTVILTFAEWLHSILMK